MYVHTCIRWLRAAFRTWSKIFLSAPAPGTVRVCIWACASFALALAIILSDDLEYRCAASAESAAYPDKLCELLSRERHSRQAHARHGMERRRPRAPRGRGRRAD